MDNWVVCRLFHKNTGIKRSPSTAGDLLRMNSFDDSEALPPLMEPPYCNGEEDYSLPSGKSTERNYLSYFSNPINDQQLQKPLFFQNNYSYQPAPGNEQSQFYPPYTFPSSQSFQGNFEKAILRDRQCKLEQFSSNQSMVSLSQDTGLSTDMNPVISSVGSKEILILLAAALTITSMFLRSWIVCEITEKIIKNHSLR